MINVCVSGAAGRMGKTLVEAAHLEKFTTLTAALEHSSSKDIGADSGLIAGVSANDVMIRDSLNSDSEFDVLIEFTTPEATASHIDFCVENRRRMVIGTTGMSKEHLDRLRQAADEIGIVFAPNMSVGVNVCFSLVGQAARALGDSVDIEVIEAHHSRKVDAPSGTALKLGEVIAEELGRTLDADGVFVRHGKTGARDRKSIGFATIRGGDIVGDHTVMFAGAGERIEITHRSNSRMNYAMGAMRAAKWLNDKPAGLYDMQDVLELY